MSKAFSPCQCHVDSVPLSRTTRTASGARFRITVAIASGSDRLCPRQITLPASSTTHTLVSFNETSNPTYWATAALPLWLVPWGELSSTPLPSGGQPPTDYAMYQM
jgi:hypothetical protein